MNNKMNKYYILILLIFMDYGKKLWINKIGKILITIILLGNILLMNIKFIIMKKIYKTQLLKEIKMKI